MTMTATPGRGFGWPGTLAADQMPLDWASIVYFPFYPDRDMTNEYVGPVLEDNADFIVIDVFGSPMTFSRDRVIVTYPL